MQNPVRIGLVFDTRAVYARREVSGVIAYARSPHAEIQRLRLERARQMLRETSLPIAAVFHLGGVST